MDLPKKWRHPTVGISPSTFYPEFIELPSEQQCWVSGSGGSDGLPELILWGVIDENLSKKYSSLADVLAVMNNLNIGFNSWDALLWRIGIQAGLVSRHRTALSCETTALLPLVDRRLGCLDEEERQLVLNYIKAKGLILRDTQPAHSNQDHQ